VPNPGTTLRSRAAELRAIASALEAEADALDRTAQQTGSEALGLAELREAFGFTRESLKTAQAHGLAVHKGPRGRVMAFRSDVESWIRSRAWTPTARKVERSEDDALDAALAELSALGGLNTRSTQDFSAGSGEGDENAEAPVQGKRALRAIGGGRR
jgi:hypothetical protein